jgi:hypothetical protein
VADNPSSDDRDDAPELTTEQLRAKDVRWHIGGKQVSEQEGKAAFREALSKDFLCACTARRDVVKSLFGDMLVCIDCGLPVEAWRPCAECARYENARIVLALELKNAQEARARAEEERDQYKQIAELNAETIRTMQEDAMDKAIERDLND